MKTNYQVIVGNIGTVYEGSDGFTATHTFNNYVAQSKSNHGRASGESVTMFKDGEIHREHIGEIDQEEI